MLDGAQSAFTKSYLPTPWTRRKRQGCVPGFDKWWTVGGFTVADCPTPISWRAGGLRVSITVGVESFRRGRCRIGPQRAQPLLNVWQLHGSRDLAAQFGEQYVRRLRRRQNTEPGIEHVARHSRFRYRRYIG